MPSATLSASLLPVVSALVVETAARVRARECQDSVSVNFPLAAS
jgi:hypothetical protein